MRELSFEQTVPRSLVHRAALAEVYVADSMRAGEDEFVLAVQIPRAHCVWFDRRVAYHDPLSTAEAARQGVYVAVHRHIGVPSGLTFSLHRLQWRVAELEAYRDHGRPLEGVLTLRLVKHVESLGALGSMTFEGTFVVADGVAMTLSGDLVFLPADDYTALRAYQRRRHAGEVTQPAVTGPALAAAASGRRDERNSLLGEPEPGARYPVIADPDHPAYFDHAYDHAPGPLIVEAYRQAAIVTAHRAGALPSPVAAITGCEAAFAEFAELDARLEVVATLDEAAGERVGVALELVQFGKAISSGHVELCAYPEGTPLQ